MSNKFNKLTQQITRPKVCESEKPEKFNGILETDPEEEEIEIGGQAFFNIKAWFDELPIGQDVSMSVAPQISTVILQENPVNIDDFTGDFELDNLVTLGQEIITVKVVFSDGSVRYVFPKVTWVEI